MLAALPDRLRHAQRVFSRTGGLHAAGLFTAGGELIAVREDVGRHNAVDKVVGWALLGGRLLKGWSADDTPPAVAGWSSRYRPRGATTFPSLSQTPSTLGGLKWIL